MSKNTDSLGDRMKVYERVPRTFLIRRVPAIIRLDGKAFHTFTRGLEKPFDLFLMSVMQETMKYLCENIQGCVFGYTQSDEITLVLTDYEKTTTDAWFGYNIQKMTSVAASMATLAFNKLWEDRSVVMWDEHLDEALAKEHTHEEEWAAQDRISTLMGKNDMAMFDARVFSLPKTEVVNCLIWRQQDAIRNSIEAVGQANFSHNQLHKKTCDMIKGMLMTERGINWEDFPTECKRGSCCYRIPEDTRIPDPRHEGEFIDVHRRRWNIDTEIPVFTEDRGFVGKWL